MLVVVELDPLKLLLKQVAHDPWGPIVWGLNEPGMQANNVADIDVEMQSLWSWRNIAKEQQIQQRFY
jgi:hypothetical protein